MSRQITQTTVMSKYRRITQENKVRKYTRVTLNQYEYDGEYDGRSFFILTHSVEYSELSDQPHLSDTVNEYVIRDGKEAMIRTISLWNSVVMEKDYAPDAPAEDDGFPF